MDLPIEERETTTLALKQLSPRVREAFLLSLVGYDEVEAGKIMGIARQTAGQYVRQARARLAEWGDSYLARG